MSPAPAPCKKRPGNRIETRHDQKNAVGGIYLPYRRRVMLSFQTKNISSAFGLFRLTRTGWDDTLESEGRAIRVGRVVVVHLPVVVDIHKVGRVASISRGQPPVVATVENGFAEHNPLTARGLTRRVRFIRFLDDFRAVSPCANQHVGPVNQVPGLFELCRHRMVRVDFPVVELR